MRGAMGNIIDCVFMVKYFQQVIIIKPLPFLPETGGYAPFMQGKVVDMFQLDLFTIGNFNFFLQSLILPCKNITIGLFITILFLQTIINFYC